MNPLTPPKKFLKDYLKKANTNSRAKVEEYFELLRPECIEDLFERKNIELFFEIKEGSSTKNLRAALVNLHNFAIDTGYIDKYHIFPIEANEVSGLGTKGRRGRSDNFYIPRKFNLNMFYEENLESYKNEENKLIVRASIALMLGAGYRTEHLLNMLVEDYDAKNKTVVNKHKLKKESIVKREVELVDNIQLVSPAAECMEQYWNYFWKTYEYEKIRKRKFFELKSPSLPLRATLIEISEKMGLEEKITPTDLWVNMMLHSLYNSNGSSLIDLIRIFGTTSDTLKKVLTLYYNDIEMKMIQTYDPNVDTCQDEDLEQTGTIRNEVTVQRVVRDSNMARSLKEMYNNTCQICQTSLLINNNKWYSECHHVKPLGEPHRGEDIWENLIVLCPNHHAMFDLGALAIHPETNTVYKIDNDKYVKDEELILIQQKDKHRLNPKYLKYHWEKIFLPNIYPIKSK